jgi:hypothetical protein
LFPLPLPLRFIGRLKKLKIFFVVLPFKLQKLIFKKLIFWEYNFSFILFGDNKNDAGTPFRLTAIFILFSIS